MNSLFRLIKDDLVLDIASQFQNMYLLLATMVHKTFKITKLKRLWTKNGCPFCSIKYSPILSASSTKTCSKDDFPKPKSLKLLSENLLWDFHDDPSLNKSPKKIDWFWTLHIIRGKYYCKVETVLKGIAWNRFHHLHLQWKFKLLKVCSRCKGKTLLAVVNKLLKTKSLLTSPNNVLPYNQK